MKNLTLLLLFVITLISCSKENIEQQLTKAKTLHQNGNYAQTSILLKKILKHTPSNIDARILLAKTYTQQGLFINAEKEWDRVVDKNIQLENIALPYLETLYIINDMEGVHKFWQKNNLSFSRQTKVQVSYIVALTHLKENELSTSKQLLTQAKEWALTLNDLNAVDMYNNLLQTLDAKDNETQIDTLNKACLLNEKSWVICSLAANAQFVTKQYAKAAINFESLIKQRPFYNQYYIFLAESYVKTNNIEKAAQHLTYLLKLFPHQAYINQLKAMHSIQTQNFELAKRHIDITIAQGFSNSETKLLAGLINYQLENYEQVISYLSALKKDFPNNNFIQKILIASQLKLGNTKAAYNNLNDLELTDENTQMVAMAGLELLKIGDSKKSAQLLSKLNTQNIDDETLLANIGIAKLSTGDNSGIDDLEKLFNSLVKKDPTSNEASKGKYLLISSLIATKQSERAEQKINQWIIETPKELENYLLLAEIYKQKQPGNLNKLKNIYTQILILQKDNFHAHLFYAEIYYNEKNYNRSYEHFTKAVISNSNSLKALQGLLLASNQLNVIEEALIYIEKLFNDYKTNPEHSLLLAKVYSLAGKPQKTIKLLAGQMIEDSRLNYIRNILLGDAYLSQKKYSKATVIYLELLKGGTFNSNILIKQLYAYEKSFQIDKATQLLESLIIKHPDNLQIGLLLANFQALSNKPNKALRFVASLTPEQQKISMVQSIKGKSFYQQKKYKIALPLLKVDYENTSNARVAAFIFDSQVKLNQTDSAMKFMQQHIEKFPDDLINRILYVHELIKHDRAKAIVQYKIIIKQDKNNLLSLNNLAWYLYEQNKLKEAFDYAQRAKNIAPNNTNIMDTYNKIKIALKNK